MRDWIAVIVAVLGVALVLAGATLIVLRALAEGREAQPAPAAAPDDVTTEVPHGPLTPAPATPVIPAPAAPAAMRLVKAVTRTTAADRLILWGIVLLVLAAISAGAISFNLGAAGGTPTP